MLRRNLTQIENRPLNDLRSGPKIGNTAKPDNSIQDLEPLEIHQLATALGKAMPVQPAATDQAEREAIRQTLGRFTLDLAQGLKLYDNAFLERLGPTGPLSGAEVAELKVQMEKTHMKIACRTEDSETGSESLHLRVYFDGTRNMRDARQDVATGLGMTGSIDQASKRIGELFAKIVAPPQFAHLDMVGGFSMGGGSAQIFMAAVESRVSLPKQPAVILLDPVLLNNRQAKFARKDGDLPVNYAKPRGVAITLGYEKKPHRGVMTKMKTFGGYKYPGLVKLKLGLADDDGIKGGVPRPFPVGMGYHGNIHAYTGALLRFCVRKKDAAPAEASLAGGEVPSE